MPDIEVRSILVHSSAFPRFSTEPGSFATSSYGLHEHLRRYDHGVHAASLGAGVGLVDLAQVDVLQLELLHRVRDRLVGLEVEVVNVLLHSLVERLLRDAPRRAFRRFHGHGVRGERGRRTGARLSVARSSSWKSGKTKQLTDVFYRCELRKPNRLHV
jgi:hypothetical protein